MRTCAELNTIRKFLRAVLNTEGSNAITVQRLCTLIEVAARKDVTQQSIVLSGVHPATVSKHVISWTAVRDGPGYIKSEQDAHNLRCKVLNTTPKGNQTIKRWLDTAFGKQEED